MVGLLLRASQVSQAHAEKPAVTTTAARIAPVAMSASDRAFVDTADEYKRREQKRELAELNEEWKGDKVTWQGRVTDLPGDGRIICIEPLDKSRDLHCTVFAPQHISGIKLGQIVTVTAEIRSVSCLGVIVLVKRNSDIR